MTSHACGRGQHHPGRDHSHQDRNVHHRIKVVKQNCLDLTLPSKWTRTTPGKWPPQCNRATGTLHCRHQAFRPVPFSCCMPLTPLPASQDYGERMARMIISLFLNLCRPAPSALLNLQMCIRLQNEGLMHCNPTITPLSTSVVDGLFLLTVWSHAALAFSVTWGRVALLFFAYGTYQTNARVIQCVLSTTIFDPVHRAPIINPLFKVTSPFSSLIQNWV